MKELNKFFIVVLLVFPALVIAATDIEEAKALLSKMHKAAHMQNYKGTFVYGQNNKLSTMKIIHSVDANGERERLVSMDGTGREVIRNKNSVTCILPDKKSVVVEKSRPSTNFPPAFPMAIESLVENYTFKVSEQSYVAGRKVQKLEILPKDKYRYGHNIWVDSEKGLLLKTNLVDQDGEAIETFMFTSVSFLDSVPEKLLTPTISGKNFTWYEADEPDDVEEKHTAKWQVKNMPSGFKEDMMRQHKMPVSKSPMDHMVISDGLASVSVFIEQKEGNNSNMIGGSRMGAVNAHRRVMDNYYVTVVGEVPQSTVRLICESVTPVVK